MKITEQVAQLAEPVARAAGCELWDVEYTREGGERFLRVYLDRTDRPVCIDDCEAVSRALDPILDEADPIPESYTFEVCSAGAERVLKRPSDFARFMGSDILIRLYRAVDGAKEYEGVLTGWQDGAVTALVNGEEKTFPPETVALVRLRVTF